MEISWKLLGENVRRAREKAGLTQEDAAQRLGEPVEWLTQAEYGKRMMTLESVMALCHALGATPSDLLNGILVLTDEDGKNDI